MTRPITPASFEGTPLHVGIDLRLKRCIVSPRSAGIDHDPDPKDLKALKERPGLWRHAADLAEITEEDIVDALSGKSVLVRESLRRGLKEMKAEFGYDEAPALERLLIEQLRLAASARILPFRRLLLFQRKRGILQ